MYLEVSISLAKEQPLPVTRESRFSVELLAFCKTSLGLLQEISFQFLIPVVVRRRGADGRIPVRTLDRGASSSATAAEPTGYPGGPYDTSLLVKYEHHVARHIWFGEERGPKKELKVAGHGLKLTSRVPLALPPQMESWIRRDGSGDSVSVLTIRIAATGDEVRRG
ncbi:hypothetical protein KIW84_035275 [Lathyrus oleraceus]|uniref:Uncharacterized protein n=1 Tax=Pisum sativum TaxID=3888 RepID=A0A9D4Y664_PEA|nr:hypothetical protein KIW84_035275 [Pisum sativum]